MSLNFNVIGLMSGTSLDGLDIAYCVFNHTKMGWKYKIKKAETIKYTALWKKNLKESENSSGLELSLFDRKFGHFIGKEVRKFTKKHSLTPDFIGSHGHTLFHLPKKHLSLQIGSGAAIAAETGLPVVCDFRSLDVALGGQGAPLVPIGDQLLFQEYEYLLNLGGIANITMQNKKNTLAFDICAANYVLNRLMESIGKSYDKNGALAKSGKLNKDLFDALNALPFFTKKAPKSLGREWIEAEIFPLLKTYNIPLRDKLNTFCCHIAFQISRQIEKKREREKKKKVLVTGGGAKNKFLMEKISEYVTNTAVHIPSNLEVEFKEALIFAFLAVLRMQRQVNCLRSVTGASKDNVGGAVYWG